MTNHLDFRKAGEAIKRLKKENAELEAELDTMKANYDQWASSAGELTALREDYEQATEHLRLLGEYPDTKPDISYSELQAELAALREMYQQLMNLPAHTKSAEVHKILSALQEKEG